MEYISTKQCAKKWVVSERTVQILCNCGKIKGAKQIGRTWLIPANSTKPIDGRTKKAKQTKAFDDYCFPILIFSELYNSANTLKEDEKNLREAQLLYLEGEYDKSIILCRHIVYQTESLHIKIGAYITIGYNAMLLRLIGEYNSTIATLNTLIEKASSNKEDYKLIYAGLLFHLSWDPKLLLEIDITNLSFCALQYYQYIMVLQNLINVVPLSNQTVSSLYALNKYTELNKIDPLNVMTGFIIAFINFKAGRIELTNFYNKSACDIAIKNNWINCLEKFYAMLSTFIDNYIKQVDINYLNKIKKITNDHVLNWRLVSNIYNGGTTLDKIPIKYFDFAILLSIKKTDKEIAKIKNLSITTIKSNVDELLHLTNLKTRAELIKYCKHLLHKFK